MSDYYVNNTSGNDTTGDGTQGNPYKTVAKVLGLVGFASGDRVYATLGASSTGEVIAAPIALPVNGAAGSRCAILGANSSWLVDGSRYIIDGNNSSAAILSYATRSFWEFRNLTLKRATAQIMYAVSGNFTDSFFDNVSFENSGTYGFSGSSTSGRNLFTRCRFLNIGTYALNQAVGHVVNCEFRNCGTGIHTTPGVTTYVGNVFISCGSNGIASSTGLILMNIFEGGTTNISASNGAMILGNRFCNSTTALSTAGAPIADFNSFYNVTNNFAGGGWFTVIENANALSGNEAYADKTNNDLRLNGSASLRRYTRDVGLIGSPTKMAWTAGLPPIDRGISQCLQGGFCS
jgi:hypothetical protein